MQRTWMRWVVACWAVGAASGALLNALNGQICPAHFQRVLRWYFPGVAEAAMLQGVFEGALYGVLVAVVLGRSWMRDGLRIRGVERGLFHGDVSSVRGP